MSTSETVTAKPDAVIFPPGFDPPGETALDRESRVWDYLEKTLGGKVHVRTHADSRFATGSPYDTLLYPTGHAWGQRPRYEWTDQPNGAQFGTLKTY